MLKTLFIHESVYKKFRRHYSDYINFEVIEIKKLEHGDISDRLLNDFNCCVGELYYAI
jgi:RNase P/RNase MRP subunit POP5